MVVRRRATGPALVPVLQLTGVAELLYAAGMLIGVAISVLLSGS
jgi:1,4-dihydroxy-2-naphthoate octaprenyltransferase